MKKDLVLLHGALGCKEQLEPLTALLSEQFSIHLMDFEGHGRRQSELPYSIDLFVENLLTYLEDNNLTEVSVFGYSMGGYVALSAAIKAPQRFSKIITLGTKFSWSPAEAKKEIQLLNREIIQEKVPAFANRLSHLHGKEHWQNLMLKTAQMMKEMGDSKRTEDALFKTVSTPSVIGIGDKDKMVTQEETKKYADLVGGEYVCLTDIPHPIDMINPNRIKDYLLRYL